MDRTQLIIGGVAAGSLVVGAVAGYFASNRVLKAKYEAIANEEIREARARYAMMHKKDEFETPEKAVKALIPEDDGSIVVKEAVEADPDRVYVGEVAAVGKALVDYGAASANNVATEEQVMSTIQSIFDSSDPTWDYDVEIQDRDGRDVYVISREEFTQSDAGYDSVTCAYFAKDGILVDSEDEPVEDEEERVGNALTRFGQGSGNPSIVYVRNNILELDLEIVKNEDSYSEAVFGYSEPEEELRHSAQSRKNGRRGFYDD